jgi:two-component system, sensor histidine kinase
MSDLSFSFKAEQFNRLFPFYIHVDKNMQIIAAGESLVKICPIIPGTKLDDYCLLKRPCTEHISSGQLKELDGGMAVLELIKSNEKLSLRGQFELLESTGAWLFVGTPWFGSMDQVRHYNLTLKDFAIHDPMIDLLHVLKTQEIGTEDLKVLLGKINEQKNALKAANKEIQEIALFPMQNPDPLVRIDMEGNILRQNPAADSFEVFEYKQQTYNAAAFWKVIAQEIDKTKDRWFFEASAGNQTYSFVCRYLNKEGYFNFYGRNITAQKKIEQELQRLSLVASANENGVVFTNEKGQITWANEGFAKLTGYTHDEIKDRTPIELCLGPLTDSKVPNEMVEQFNTGKSFNVEGIHYRKDGTWFWGRSKGQAVATNDDDEKQYFTILEDISARKKQDEQLNILSLIAADNANGVVIADKEGNIEWANKSFEKITGYSLDELLGKKPGNLLQGKDTDPEKIAYLRKQIQHGEPFSCEILNYNKQKEPYWLRIQGQALKDANGNIEKYFAIEQDVTSEVENRLKIQEFENRFRLALEQIGDNVWEHDFRTGKTIFSKSENDFLGVKISEPGNNNSLWWSSIFPEDLPLVQENDSRYKSCAIDHHVLEYRMLHKSGEIKWVLDRGVVIEKTPDGKPIKIVGTHTDISKIKATEKALRASEAEFRSLAENIPGVLYKYAYHTDGTENFIYLSPQCEEKIGIAENDLNDFYQILHPEDREAEKAIALESKNNSTPYHFEGRFNVPGKPEIWLSISSAYTQTTSQGSIIHTGIMLNVTKEKEAAKALRNNEEKYRGIIANMNLGLLEVDLKENIQVTNQSFCEMSGYTEDELIGKKADSLFIPQEYAGLMAEKNTIRGEGISDAYEIAARNKKGELRWWFISAAPRYNQDGKQIGSIGIHLDITDRKKLEVQLRKARLLAEESVKAKEVFLANMSHEIRTPLNAIIGMSSQMNRTLLTEKQSFYLSTIHTAADNLLVIINDILDLSKIEAGKLSLEKIGFEPKEVIKRAIQVLNHKAEEKGLALTNTYCDEKLAPVLLGDPYRLNQILLNLLGNSIKFTEKGSVDLACRIVSASASSQRILICVTDTGIGMEEAFVNKLFEKFTQEYESVSRRYGGTGLGMSISKELVELMGGSIDVKSKKGEGTTITLSIDFETGSTKDLPVVTALPTDAKILYGKTILVADDNEMNRLVAKTVVENYGANTIEAVNGKEATEILKKDKNISLVLMDVQMPVMNGLDATGYIRKELASKVPIIALTANAIKGESSKCIAAGMNDYISKPFKEEEFIGIIAKWLTTEPTLAGVSMAEKETEYAFDILKLEEIARGDEGFILKMIKIFIDQTPGLVEAMKQDWLQKDLEGMSAKAHKIKPTIDTMNINSLKEIIRDIERMGKAGENSQLLPELLDKTTRIIQAIAVKLKNTYFV